MSSRARTGAVAGVATGLLVAVAVVWRQIEDQRYRTTPLWGEPTGWVVAGAATTILAASAIATSRLGRGGLPAVSLLGLWVMALAISWDAGPVWLRALCFAAGAFVPLCALRWVERAVGSCLRPAWWAVALAVSSGAFVLSLVLYQPLRDLNCVALCGASPWSLGHLGMVAGLPVAAATLVACALGALLARDVLRSTRAVGATLAVLTAVVASVAVPLGSRPAVPPELATSVAAAASLIAVCLTTDAVLLDVVRRRRRLSSLVSSLSTAPQAAELEAALSRALGGPVSISYPDPSGPGAIDARGNLARGPVDDRIEVTSRGAVTAWLSGPGVRDWTGAGGLTSFDPSTALLVENASVLARLRQQVERVRSARAAVVTASDGARQRLERDLHDGSQQLVLALAIDVRLLTAGLPAGSTERSRAQAAQRAVSAALDELRSIAHRVHPATLEQSGLRGALDVLSQATGVPIILDGHADLGLDELVAVFRLVESVVDQVAARPSTTVSTMVVVTMRQEAGLTRVSVDPGGHPVVVDVEADRLAALGATLEVGPFLRASFTAAAPRGWDSQRTATQGVEAI